MTQHILTVTKYLQSPIEQLMSLIDGYRKYRNHRQTVRQTIKELHSLTDKELADIGIARTQILMVAEGTIHND